MKISLVYYCVKRELRNFLNYYKTMRIYNGTNSNVDIPLSGIQRLQISPKSVSGDFLPSNEFLSLLVTGYDYNEIALIVSGPYEINMCSGVPGAVGFVVQSLEEAIERFNPKEEKVQPTKVEIIEEKQPEPKSEEIKEEVKAEQEETISEPPVEIPADEDEGTETISASEEENVPVEEAAENIEEETGEVSEQQPSNPNQPRRNNNNKKNKNRKH